MTYQSPERLIRGLTESTVAFGECQLPERLIHGLTERTVAFVEIYVAQGGADAKRAAIEAGFAKSGAQAHASRLLRDERVLALLDHIVDTQLHAIVMAAMEVLKCLNRTSEDC